VQRNLHATGTQGYIKYTLSARQRKTLKDIRRPKRRSSFTSSSATCADKLLSEAEKQLLSEINFLMQFY